MNGSLSAVTQFILVLKFIDTQRKKFIEIRTDNLFELTRRHKGEPDALYATNKASKSCRDLLPPPTRWRT